MMFPLSRREDVDVIDEAEAHEDWVPGWDPHLDIWHCMSALARNQVRLAEQQLRMTKQLLFMVIGWLLVSVALLLMMFGVIH